MSLLLDRLSPSLAVVATWTLWYSVVVATNLTDLLRAAGVLPADFPWAAHNYSMFVEGSGGGVVVVTVYVAGYLWEVVTVTLLWRALVGGVRDPTRTAALARPAFALAIGFWGAFLVLLEASLSMTQLLHLGIFTSLMVSHGLIELLDRRS